MAEAITGVGHGQLTNRFASTGAEDLAIECLYVTMGATTAVIYCNKANKGGIHTKAVRQALSVMVTPASSSAAAENVAQCGAVISKTTYTGDTVTIHGVDTEVYHVLIIGRTP